MECIIDKTQYYVKYDSNKNGSVDWYGPFKITKNLVELVKDGIISLSVPDNNITRPPPIDNWTLKVVTQDDFFSNPIIINTVTFDIGINFLKYSYTKYSVKGCNLKSSPFPTNCYPPNTDSLSPCICPLNCILPKITIPTYIIILIVFTILLIIGLIISNIYFYKLKSF